LLNKCLNAKIFNNSLKLRDENIMQKNLLLKAQRNTEAGIWAEKKEYFDVAVSRFYYALYEKIIYISKKEGFYKKPPRKNPHNFVIENFKKNIFTKLENRDFISVSRLTRLKKHRVYADYKEDIIESENDFKLMFKNHYNKIAQILGRFI